MADRGDRAVKLPELCHALPEEGDRLRPRPEPAHQDPAQQQGIGRGCLVPAFGGENQVMTRASQHVPGTATSVTSKP